MVMCIRCKIRESTGSIFAYCDECFEQFEAEVAAGNMPKDTLPAMDAHLAEDGLKRVTLNNGQTVLAPLANEQEKD